jgi:hypothetical protein
MIIQKCKHKQKTETFDWPNYHHVTTSCERITFFITFCRSTTKTVNLLVPRSLTGQAPGDQVRSQKFHYWWENISLKVFKKYSQSNRTLQLVTSS